MTHTPHDALFKAVFSLPEHAEAELRAVLPARLARRIDWSTLALAGGSFIDEALKAAAICSTASTSRADPAPLPALRAPGEHRR
ncbi:MAG: Rpn family recombination-promoting nuclease/putative transposase [Sandaracinus sp.]